MKKEGELFEKYEKKWRKLHTKDKYVSIPEVIFDDLEDIKKDVIEAVKEIIEWKDEEIGKLNKIIREERPYWRKQIDGAKWRSKWNRSQREINKLKEENKRLKETIDAFPKKSEWIEIKKAVPKSKIEERIKELKKETKETSEITAILELWNRKIIKELQNLFKESEEGD